MVSPLLPLPLYAVREDNELRFPPCAKIAVDGKLTVRVPLSHLVAH